MRLEENKSKLEARQPGIFTTQGGWVNADWVQDCDILAKQFKSIFIKDRDEPENTISEVQPTQQSQIREE